MGLPSDEFWELTPRLFAAYQRAWLQHERLADRRAGLLAALYYNAHLPEGKEAVDWDFFFPDGSRKPAKCDTDGIMGLFGSLAEAMKAENGQDR